MTYKKNLFYHCCINHSSTSIMWIYCTIPLDFPILKSDSNTCPHTLTPDHHSQGEQAHFHGITYPKSQYNSPNHPSYSTLRQEREDTGSPRLKLTWLKRPRGLHNSADFITASHKLLSVTFIFQGPPCNPCSDKIYWPALIAWSLFGGLSSI